MTGGQCDAPVVRRHLAALRTAIGHLRRHVHVSAAQLAADTDLCWAIERGLQLSAQCALDLATHLASAAGHDTPDYASSIDALVAENVLPPAFGNRFRQMAGFRNVLVHGYMDVDLEVVANVLRDHLDDFEAFARHVESAVGRLTR